MILCLLILDYIETSDGVIISTSLSYFFVGQKQVQRKKISFLLSFDSEFFNKSVKKKASDISQNLEILPKIPCIARISIVLYFRNNLPIFPSQPGIPQLAPMVIFYFSSLHPHPCVLSRNPALLLESLLRFLEPFGSHAFSYQTVESQDAISASDYVSFFLEKNLRVVRQLWETISSLSPQYHCLFGHYFLALVFFSFKSLLNFVQYRLWFCALAFWP